MQRSSQKLHLSHHHHPPKLPTPPPPPHSRTQTRPTYRVHPSFSAFPLLHRTAIPLSSLSIRSHCRNVSHLPRRRWHPHHQTITRTKPTTRASHRHRQILQQHLNRVSQTLLSPLRGRSIHLATILEQVLPECTHILTRTATSPLLLSLFPLVHRPCRFPSSTTQALKPPGQSPRSRPVLHLEVHRLTHPNHNSLASLLVRRSASSSTFTLPQRPSPNSPIHRRRQTTSNSSSVRMPNFELVWRV